MDSIRPLSLSLIHTHTQKDLYALETGINLHMKSYATVTVAFASSLMERGGEYNEMKKTSSVSVNKRLPRSLCCQCVCGRRDRWTRCTLQLGLRVLQAGTREAGEQRGERSGELSRRAKTLLRPLNTKVHCKHPGQCTIYTVCILPAY